MSFTHALYHLVSNPHVVEPLRNEVETVIAKEGWSKAAMVQLRLMDSFLKESQRHVGAGAGESRPPYFLSHLFFFTLDAHKNL